MYFWGSPGGGCYGAGVCYSGKGRGQNTLIAIVFTCPGGQFTLLHRALKLIGTYYIDLVGRRICQSAVSCTGNAWFMGYSRDNFDVAHEDCSNIFQ
jgi:hypothetical protein